MIRRSQRCIIMHHPCLSHRDCGGKGPSGPIRYSKSVLHMPRGPSWYTPAPRDNKSALEILSRIGLHPSSKSVTSSHKCSADRGKMDCGCWKQCILIQRGTETHVQFCNLRRERTASATFCNLQRSPNSLPETLGYNEFET